MKDDNRFAIVGISQTIILLIVTAIASTNDTILTYFKFTVLIITINSICYVILHIWNKKH